MQTARVTWFGKEGKLHLQLKSFPAQREVKCRLDEITLPERKRHRDLLLVTRSDGALINVGALVPKEEAVAALRRCPVVDDGHTGFLVALPSGYGIVDNMFTSQLNVIPAEEIPLTTKQPDEPVALTVDEVAPGDENDPPHLKFQQDSSEDEEVVDETTPESEETPEEEEPEEEASEDAAEDETPESEDEEETEDDDLLDLMGD